MPSSGILHPVTTAAISRFLIPVKKDTLVKELNFSNKNTGIQWNLDLTKCPGNRPIGSLHRGLVNSKTSL